MYETVEEALDTLTGGVARVADGFNDCIVGIASRCGQPDLVVYDSTKIIDKLVERDGMSYDDAVEFYEFNIVGAWAGEGTPLYLTPIAGAANGQHLPSTSEECSKDRREDQPIHRCWVQDL